MTLKIALVTGSDGFVGRHVMAELQHRGWATVGVDTKSDTDCRTIFRDSFRYDLVVHCAAIVGGREQIENNPLALVENYELDAMMVQYCARVRPGHVIIMSSSAVYPERLQTSAIGARLLHEHDVLPHSIEQPDPSVYGMQKLALEGLGDMLRELGLTVTTARPFSGYGDDQDETYPFPAIMSRVIKKEDPLIVWGSGHQVRDFIHIDDVARQLVHLAELKYNRPINLCTGVGTSFVDLAQMASDMLGYTPLVMCDNQKPMGVFRRVGHPGRIDKIHPARISIEEGIARALETGE